MKTRIIKIEWMFRTEYVIQVKRWYGWKTLDTRQSYTDAKKIIFITYNLPLTSIIQ